MRYDERGCGLSGPDDVTAGLVAGPEVQTQVEQGLPTVPVTFWWGLVRPAGMPPSIVARLNTEVAAILAEGPVQATFAAWGIRATGGSPEGFGAWIARESARWRDFAARTTIALQ